jgi:hypothetical protein
MVNAILAIIFFNDEMRRFKEATKKACESVAGWFV